MVRAEATFDPEGPAGQVRFPTVDHALRFGRHDKHAHAKDFSVGEVRIWSIHFTERAPTGWFSGPLNSRGNSRIAPTTRCALGMS